MSNEDEVREVSKQFYTGLTKMLDGDLSVMDTIWSHDETVTTMHPIDGRETGWDAVKNSFIQFSKASSSGSVKLTDQLIRVQGDLAYEIGVETGQFGLAGQPITIKQRVTNVYRREGGQWKMVHHHADLSRSMVDALKALV
jgi:ketosteroid isomerase-like protein